MASWMDGWMEVGLRGGGGERDTPVVEDHSHEALLPDRKWNCSSGRKSTAPEGPVGDRMNDRPGYHKKSSTIN